MKNYLAAAAAAAAAAAGAAGGNYMATRDDPQRYARENQLAQIIELQRAQLATAEATNAQMKASLGELSASIQAPQRAAREEEAKLQRGHDNLLKMFGQKR